MTPVLVDFDRTLTVLYPGGQGLAQLAAKVAALYAAEGISVETAQTDGYLLWHELHAAACRTHPDIAEAVNGAAEALVTDFELSAATHADPLPGVPATIAELRRNDHTLGIASSNSVDVIEAFLLQHNLRTYFEVVIGRPVPFDEGLLKPNPHSLLLAAAALAPAKTTGVAYIGDDLIDVAAALAAGFRPIAVASGNYNTAELLAAGAEAAFDSFADILTVL